eukprot:5237055-Prymnesium_polylepis.1
MPATGRLVALLDIIWQKRRAASCFQIERLQARSTPNLFTDRVRAPWLNAGRLAMHDPTWSEGRTT